MSSPAMKTKCPLVQHVCRVSFYIQYYIILVGRIDFGTNIYLLESSVHLPSLSGLSTRASFAFSGNTCLRCDRCDFHELFSPSLMVHGELGEHWLSGKTYIKQELLVTIQIDWSAGLKRSSTPGLVLPVGRDASQDAGYQPTGNDRRDETRHSSFLPHNHFTNKMHATIHFFSFISRAYM